MNPIQTKRLIIRNFAEGDVGDLHAYLSQAEIYLFEPGGPIDQEAARLLVEERTKTERFLAVEHIGSGRMIGHLYFAQIEPQQNLTWELGYIFNPAWQGQGFATEASRALVEWAFANLQVHRVIANCDQKNPASWKLLEKMGMRREGDFRQKAWFRRDGQGQPIWIDSYQYAILKDELP